MEDGGSGVRCVGAGREASQEMSATPTDVVERAKAALEGTTQSPWDAVEAAYGGEWWIELRHRRTVARELDGPDARFVAAARSLIPELVAEIERLRS